MNEISKYPIISQNNKRYKVKIKRQLDNNTNDILTCYLYKKLLGIPVRVYHESVNYIVIDDLQNLVRSTVHTYEYLKGYGRQVHYNLEKFNEWDGDLRINKEAIND